MNFFDLSEDEFNHLKKYYAGVYSLAELKQAFAFQKKLRAAGKREACLKCKAIAQKLGFPL